MQESKNKPLRILQVLGRLDRGGAETMIMNLYRRMDRERVQFDFVIHTEDICDYSEEVESLGGRIYAMEPFRASTAVRYKKNWQDFFKAHKEYRVIHGHMRSTASLYLAAAKRAGLVTIAHSHNTSSGAGVSAVVKNMLQYPLRYTADYLFSCSYAAGVWLYGKKACEKPNFHILPNGIEPEAFRFQHKVREKKRREMDAEGKTVFLHVGRLEAQKNHAFLLKIFKAACVQAADKKNTPGTEKAGMQKAGTGECRLWLCGAGELETEILYEAEALGVREQVDFLGVRKDIPELMMAADVMVFPSLFEGLPVTLVEAQAAGLPVLMSDRITEEVMLTDNVQRESLLCPPAGWANRALSMIKEGRQDGISQIVESGYDVETEAEKLQTFYEKVWQA